MNNINDLTDLLVKFRDARDWKQFHNPKDLAISISIEAGELLEAFQWQDNDTVDQQAIKEELADVLSYCLLLAHERGINIEAAIREKVEKNSVKYPVEKSKGSAKKYNKL